MVDFCTNSFFVKCNFNDHKSEHVPIVEHWKMETYKNKIKITHNPIRQIILVHFFQLYICGCLCVYLCCNCVCSSFLLNILSRTFLSGS